MKDYWIMSKAIVFEVVGRALLYTAKAVQIQCLVLGIWEPIILFFKSITLKVVGSALLYTAKACENNCTTSSPWEPIILFYPSFAS
ncbi:hypothetical protein ES332_D11G345200v1 [Gossypium tomentosum]|uniref:Uncharacterized protein n=1 Tax=Gossypium tomentosum TaxID=34277 RepID=A0A5D2IW27_GOSTO|nr:hypothetical protein ES332_D11G345200v1 [Gossypium tomentosum]